MCVASFSADQLMASQSMLQILCFCDYTPSLLVINIIWQLILAGNLLLLWLYSFFASSYMTSHYMLQIFNFCDCNLSLLLLLWQVLLIPGSFVLRNSHNHTDFKILHSKAISLRQDTLSKDFKNMYKSGNRLLCGKMFYII